MRDCCSTPAVGLTTAGAIGAVWFRCRDRLCPKCSRCRAAQVVARVQAATSKADALRFLTLTVRSESAPLIGQLDSLYAWFRSFRKRPEFKRHVRGGIAFLEVTRHHETGLFHPHLHVLTDGSYWAQTEISRVWSGVTGGSCIVDIRAVRSRKTAAEYVAKYAAKPPNMRAWPDDAIADYAAALHRRRALLTFGTMHNIPTDGDDEIERQSVSECRVPIAQVESRSRLGCFSAQVVLRALAESNRQYARTLETRTTKFPPILAPRTAATLALAPAEARALHARYTAAPEYFACYLHPPAPPEPEPELHRRSPSICDPKHTAPLDPSWLQPDTRHV
jgi:hypothetical protein